MPERIYERLIEVKRAELTARVWLAVEDITKWGQEQDREVGRIISATLYSHSKVSNSFEVSVDIEDALRREGFTPNAVQVQEESPPNWDTNSRYSSLLYPEWP